MSTSTIPGVDLSYADLLKSESRDDVRLAWHQIMAVADTLGVHPFESNGRPKSPRSSTIGELVAAVTKVLPEGIRVEDVMANITTVTARSHTTVFEVRNLMDNGKWLLVGEFDDEADALTMRNTEKADGAYVSIVVEVRSVVERDVLDRTSSR